MNKKLRAVSRKGRCSDCGNMATHAKTCPWAYIPETNSKARFKERRLDWSVKLKAIIKIIKA